MVYTDWYAAAALVLLLAAAAFLSGAEMALLSVGDYRLRQFAERGAMGRTVAWLLGRPGGTLSTLFIAITTLNYAAATVAGAWALAALGVFYGAPLVVVGLTLVMLVVVELAPVKYAAANPESYALAAAYPVRALTMLLWLPVRLAVGAADVLARGLGGRAVEQAVRITESDVRALMNAEAEPGLEEEERAMISSIFDFGDKVARELMVPRTDIVAVEAEATVREAAATSISRRLTRLPVYEGDLDHIVGVVNAKDLLWKVETDGEEPVRGVARQPFVVPETKPAADLLDEFRQRKQSLAVVVDEYGGTAGLVTVEDLLEEVVGEIYDEYDVEQATCRRLDERTWLLDGRLPVADVQEILGVELPTGDYDTIAGLLYDRLGNLAAAGDKVSLPGVELAAERVEGRRVAAVRATLAAPPAAEETP